MQVEFVYKRVCMWSRQSVGGKHVHLYFENMCAGGGLKWMVIGWVTCAFIYGDHVAFLYRWKIGGGLQKQNEWERREDTEVSLAIARIELAIVSPSL